MRACPDPLPAFEPAGRDGRVVQKPQRVVADSVELVKKPRVEAHTERDPPHERIVHVFAPLMETQHGQFELGAFNVESVGPLVLVALLELAADFEALL